jgi:hypothetical protein
MARLLIAVLAALLALQPALGMVKEKGRHKGHAVERDHPVERHDVAITAAEVTIIYEYIRRHGTGEFGPSKGLPPGIAKNLARGKPLPPGIAKRQLPGGLVRTLPDRPGYEWFVVDGDILLVAAATTLIMDVLRDVY